MAFMRTSNPTLNDQVFRSERAGFGDVMTVQGAVNKTGILLLCAIATAAWTWNLALHSESPQAVAPLILVGSIGGLVVAWSPFSRSNGPQLLRLSTPCWKAWCWARYRPFLK